VKSNLIVGPQRIIIIANVKREVIIAYFKVSFKISFGFSSLRVTLLAIYHPTRNPNNIQKIGTPIPIPKQSKSRKAKIKKAIFRFNLKILFIVHLPVGSGIEIPEPLE
jgi:hypothetical protein